MRTSRVSDILKNALMEISMSQTIKSVYLFISFTNNTVPVILFSYLETLRGGRNPPPKLVT